MEKLEQTVSNSNFTTSQFKLTKHLVNNLSQFDITPTAKLVLLYLSNCYNPHKTEMFPKQKTIAGKIGVSERSVVRAIQELFKEGLIIFECKYTNRYKFTSKITAQPSEITKNFTLDNLSDNKGQIDIEKSDNLSAHEQINEQKKEHTVEDIEILKNYAQKKGAKNISAYVNFLLKNNCTKNIIENEKALKNAIKKSKNRIQETKNYLAQREEDKKFCTPMPQEWFEFGKKLFG